MELIEIETKEDILCAAEIEKEVAPEVFAQERSNAYLDGIEHTIRFDIEAGAEYYIIAAGGPVGIISVRNEGDVLTLEKAEIIKVKRRMGYFKRALNIITETYDPPLLRICSYGRDIPAAEALGFEKTGEYYTKRYY